MTDKNLDIDRIARRLGGVATGTVPAGHGFFGALELLGEVHARFRTPVNGGRSTDPAWNERRLVPLASHTLERLERLAVAVTSARGQEVSAMQVAAILLENVTTEAGVADAERELAAGKRDARSTLAALSERTGQGGTANRGTTRGRVGGRRRKARKCASRPSPRRASAKRRRE